MAEFEQWWNDLKKHRKRLEHWLPHWKALANRIADSRRIRYFTLCARSMIDVFLLVREGLLEIDPESNSIKFVQFCECDQEQFVKIREMIAREDAGFFGRLEDVVLFVEDDFTGQFPTLDSINLKLEDEGLQSDLEKVDRLQLKRTHFAVRSSFPYDFINLDFCQYYYPKPPGMLRVNETVKQVLDWQRRSSEDAEGLTLHEFVLAVTCRYDLDFPLEAEARLAELIRQNCATSDIYKQQVEQTRGTTEINKWIEADREDFFFAGWPKDIAASAKELGWSMEVLDYVYYRRTGGNNKPYVIACLVARFEHASPAKDYMPSALYALSQGNRKLIGDIARNSPDGLRLIRDLETIVAAHNDQAQRKQRPPLPPP